MQAAAVPRALLLSRMAVVALALVSAYYSLHTITIMWAPNGSFGIEIEPATAVVSYIEPGAAKSGIRPGDRVDLAAMPYGERDHLYDQMLKPVGTQMTVPATRNNRTRTATLRVVSDPRTASQNLANIDITVYGWGRKVAAVLFVVTGIVLVWSRPSLMLWGLAAFSIGTHNFILGPLTAPLPDALLILGQAIVDALSAAGLLVFAGRFPHGVNDATTKYWDAGALVLFCLNFFYNVYDYIPLFTARPLAAALPDATFFASLVYLFVFVALWTRVRAMRASQRSGSYWVVAGFGVGIVAGSGAFLDVLDTITYDSAWPGIAQFSIALAFPAAIAYATTRYRTFGLGYVGNRSLVHAALTIAIAFAFLIAVWTAGWRISSALGLGAAMFVALLAGIAFQAHRSRIFRLIDRFFLPQLYETGAALDTIRETVRSTSDAKLLAGEVAERLGLASIAVFARAPDGGFVRTAACGWPERTAWHLLPDEALTRSLAAREAVVTLSSDEHADVALPGAGARPRVAVTVRRAGRVERAIFVGPARSGVSLDRDALHSLRSVFEDAVIAQERASVSVGV